MDTFQPLRSLQFFSNFEKLFDKLKFNVPLMTFLEEMVKNNVIISGSSILYCLLGENSFGDLPPSDIDIYVPFTTSETCNSSYSVQPFEHFIYNSLTTEKAKESSYGCDYNLMNDVALVRTFSTPKLLDESKSRLQGFRNCSNDSNDREEYELDIITVRKDPKEFISEVFDLSFCKVFFDGINVYGKDSLEDILSQKGTVDRLSVPCHSYNGDAVFINDCLKFCDYMRYDRLISVLSDSLATYNIEDIWMRPAKYENDKVLISLLKTITRVEKYIKRGFTITYHGAKL